MGQKVEGSNLGAGKVFHPRNFASNNTNAIIGPSEFQISCVRCS